MKDIGITQEFDTPFLFTLERIAFETAYEGESGGNDDNPGEPAPTPDPTPTPTPDPPKPDSDKEKLVPASRVNEIVAQRVKEVQAKEREAGEKTRRELLQQLERREQEASMTESERETLQKRIEELRAESLSAEEASKRTIKQLESDLTTAKEQAAKERTALISQYNAYRIEQELMQAATAHDARTPSQLVNLLRGDTKVEEVIGDDGKPTGELTVKTTITEFKEDGTPFQVECSPNDAIARLRAQPDKWGNQFNSSAQRGLDLMSDAGSAPSKKNQGIVVDQGIDAYRKSREANRELLGLPPQQKKSA